MEIAKTKRDLVHGPAKKISKGYTLVELLSVFAIAGSIILLGLRFYNNLKVDSDVRDLKNHVDLLFSAAYNYYQANCMIPYNPITDTYPTNSATNITGRLDPRFNPSINNNQTLVLSIVNDLQNSPSGNNPTYRYLTTPYPFMPFSALTDNSDPQNTFAVQLTRHDIPFNHDSRQSSGIVVHWTIQVSVKLNSNLLSSAAKAQNIQYALNADCLANVKAGSTQEIDNCSKASATGAYAVWEKTPATIAQTQSNINLIHADLIRFKYLYTVAPTRLVPVGQNNYLLCSS